MKLQGQTKGKTTPLFRLWERTGAVEADEDGESFLIFSIKAVEKREEREIHNLSQRGFVLKSNQRNKDNIN